MCSFIFQKYFFGPIYIKKKMKIRYSSAKDEYAAALTLSMNGLFTNYFLFTLIQL